MKKHLNIFGKQVPIVRTKNLMRDNNALGLFHCDKFFIEIDASLKGKEYLVTLLHESIHAIVQRAGLYQSGLSLELEEIIAEQISVAIAENFNLK